MIAYLEGQVKFKAINYLIILTHGVGYKVYVPADINSAMALSQTLSLYIHTHVKDDALDLYGFKDAENLAIFELFLSVSGIGPKTAVSIFSVGKIDRIKEAIVKGDVAFFSAVPRLGKKNAQKIIIELRSKLGSLEDLDLSPESNESKEIVEALKTFGFDVKEAVKVYAHGSIIESKMMAWLWQAYAIPGFMKNNTQIMLRNFYLNYLKKNLKHI